MSSAHDLLPKRLDWFRDRDVARNESLKIARPVDNKIWSVILPHRFRHDEERLIISATSKSLYVIATLLPLIGDPVRIQYVREHNKGPVAPGRYLLRESMSTKEVIEFMRLYSQFLLCDGRHHFWVMNARQSRAIVYDQHDMLYFYGPCASAIWRLVCAGFFPGRVPSISRIMHAHIIEPEFDRVELEIVNRPGIHWEPPVEGVDIYLDIEKD